MDATSEQTQRYYVVVPGKLPAPFQALYAVMDGQLCILPQTFLVRRPEAINACKFSAEDIERYGLTGCTRHAVTGDE
ncbi:hypothetical protein [Lacticaseibacillus thailandensis]|uniref:Uncharacterized protein n=1 Tax=Lacticaseibacillus thailandensis DSM 22698 = JCM 13996 TaxID=1423810 RepID=A0A0R2CHM4_9LACO|nr:hypothetical protein [Lacticaseibacillus thailandensis]KRM87171.1 hypothetical protein FD19_GL001325 [Lacticaseibacillus thailandensis DSM 22698 = JCM 13996]